MKKTFLPVVLCWMLLAGMLHAAVLGEMAPEVDLGPALKGKKFRLADTRGKSVTVLHFWKTGCPPCVKAVDMVNELVKRYDGKVAFMAVGAGMPDELRREPHWKGFQCPVVSDVFLRTVELYMDKNSSFPSDAVIGKDGKLLWYGPSVMLAGVLGEIMEGKYDLAAVIALERFNRQMRDAMDRKDHKTALNVLRARRKDFPDDAQLAVGEANILAASCGKPEEALQVLDQAIARTPGAYRLYQAKMQILQVSTPPHDKRRLEHYQAIAAAFRSQPRLLSHLADGMMKRQVGSFELQGVYYLARAAYKASAGLSPRERGKAASALARSYYYIGMPERAVVYQAEAVQLLKKTAEFRRARIDMLFYQSALVAAEAVRKIEAEEAKK